MSTAPFRNPFRPGAGHMPPYLAGRETEKTEFLRLVEQDVILENMILTGLRGVGKTVLLDTLKPLAMDKGWLWIGTDLSESMSITEERMTLRLIAYLAVVTSSVTIAKKQVSALGFAAAKKSIEYKCDFNMLQSIYAGTQGIPSDKIKAVLEFSWKCLQTQNRRGVIFAYDEAQNLSDHSAKSEYPLSLMLDVFQSLQKKNIPYMLALTGLPTLFPKLVEARTFSERMFHVIFLDRLETNDSRDAIMKPIENARCPVKLGDGLVKSMIRISGGYPYFIQFLGREVYDLVIQRMADKRHARKITIPFEEIIRKLDNDFFAGRWAKATDRERALLHVISLLPECDREFSVQGIARESKRRLARPFSSSRISQMLSKLADAGLVFKNRHGKYSFAVPLLGSFIQRQNYVDHF